MNVLELAYQGKQSLNLRESQTHRFVLAFYFRLVKRCKYPATSLYINCPRIGGVPNRNGCDNQVATRGPFALSNLIF